MMAEVSISDKTVLLKLYTATNGANWNTTGLSSLYLLGMVLKGDKIVSINLSDNNLVGEIPNEIVSLTDLKVELTQNSISGVIPFNLEYKELVVLIFHLIN
jgi:hypothetical protein